MKKSKKKRCDGNKKQEQYLMVSLKGCGSCIAAKELLKSKGRKYKLLEYEMDNNKAKNEWNDYIKREYKKEHKTFPKIFTRNKFIGGYNDLLEII